MKKIKIKFSCQTKFLPCMSRSIGMYRFNTKPVNRPLDWKTYLDFLSITTWAQNPCREWNQSVSSLSRAVEGKYIVTLDKELNIWDKTLKDKWRQGDDRWDTNRTEEAEKLMSPRKRSFTMSASAEMTLPSVVRDLLIFAPSWKQTILLYDLLILKIKRLIQPKV